MTPVSRIHLIRHARPASVWGDGDPDPGLDEVGAAQAEAVADLLMGLPPEQRPTAVASSPLQRCRETAQPLAEALGVTAEIEPGVGEIPTPAGLEASARGAWLRRSMAGRWARGPRRSRLRRLEARRAGRGDGARPGWAVFSHFVAINAVVSLLSASDEVVLFRPDHTSVTILDGEAGGIRLIARGREAATGVL